MERSGFADGKIAFTSATSLTLLLDAGTDFIQDRNKGWRGPAPHAAITARLDAAAKTPYERLLAAHLQDYQALFSRVALDLGTTDSATAALPTDKRLMNYRKDDARDPALESLAFQYGRYLLIASSRAGGLPANLQGKWNQSNHPPWRCDWHTDVNVQMNYWPAGPANLNECFPPFAEWLYSIRAVRAAETRADFHARGWTMHGENGLFGGGTWKWVLPSSAWCAQNLWDHYAFSGDKEYLRTRAYPMMKEICEFWLDTLQALPDGTLVSPSGFSPEHGPSHGKSTQGVSFDQELVWDLFNNTVEAADVLGVDREFRDTVAAKRDKLLVPKIGKWGQLQEWMEDLDDPNDTHRHLSHLVGLYPGRQISPFTTPKLAAAAKVSPYRPRRWRDRLEQDLEDQPLGPPARRRPRLQDRQRLAEPQQCVAESLRQLPALSNRRQLRLHRRRLRDAVAIARRGDRVVARAAEMLAGRQRQRSVRPRRL